MANRNLCFLVLSMFVSTNLCYGMEYDKSRNSFKTKCDLCELAQKPDTIGSSFFSVIYKSDYQGKKCAIKIFSDEYAFEYEKEISEKIREYNKKNSLSPNLMKCFGVTSLDSSYSSEFTSPSKYNALVFEYIDGITLEKWKENNKFENVESFIDDFCVPLINAFKKYNEITGKYNEFIDCNIMMKKSGEKWIPVLIDYGKSNLRNYGPIFYLVNTLYGCLRQDEYDHFKYFNERCPKLYYLKDLLKRIENELYYGKSFGCSDTDIKLIDKLLEEIKKIRN